MSWKPKTLKKLKKMRTSRLPTKSTALSWKASVTKILMNVRLEERAWSHPIYMNLVPQKHVKLVPPVC